MADDGHDAEQWAATKYRMPAFGDRKALGDPESSKQGIVKGTKSIAPVAVGSP